MLKDFFTALGTGALNKMLHAVLVLVIGLLIIRVVTKLLQGGLEKSHLEKAAHSLILSLAKVAMYILLGLSVASSLGIDVTGIVALASVLTLAVSLSLQNMLTNVIGGFPILSTPPFHSGDYVEIAGQSGTVQEINMTYTRLATFDNKLISIPNSAVVAAQIVNYSAADTRRVDIPVSASYDAPTQKVIDALVHLDFKPDVIHCHDWQTHGQCAPDPRPQRLREQLRRQRHCLHPSRLGEDRGLLGRVFRPDPAGQGRLRRAGHHHDLPPSERTSG